MKRLDIYSGVAVALLMCPFLFQGSRIGGHPGMEDKSSFSCSVYFWGHCCIVEEELWRI